MAVQNDNTILNKGDLKAYHEKIAPMLGGTFMVSTNNSDYYSTDEKIVGVWTDGKPVYQKTWVNVNVSGMVDGVNHNIIDITSLHADTTVKIEAIAHQVTSGQKFDYANNFFSPDTSTTNLKVNVWRRAENYIGFNATVLQITSVNVTFCYTKTTDAAGSAAATPGAYDIKFPNTWPANKEIFFGNGVYGYRAVDKTTGISVPAVTSGGVVAEAILTNTAGAEYLIDEGGVVYYNNFDKPYHQAFKYSSYANGEGAWGTGSLIHANGITMQFNQEAYYGKTRASFTGYYDVWFKYSK